MTEVDKFTVTFRSFFKFFIFFLLDIIIISLSYLYFTANFPFSFYFWFLLKWYSLARPFQIICASDSTRHDLIVFHVLITIFFWCVCVCVIPVVYKLTCFSWLISICFAVCFVFVILMVVLLFTWCLLISTRRNNSLLCIFVFLTLRSFVVHLTLS